MFEFPSQPSRPADRRLPDSLFVPGTCDTAPCFTSPDNKYCGAGARGDLQPVASSGSWARFIPGLLLCNPQELSQALNLLQRQAGKSGISAFNSLLSKIPLRWLSTGCWGFKLSLGDPEDGGSCEAGIGLQLRSCRAAKSSSGNRGWEHCQG